MFLLNEESKAKLLKEFCSEIDQHEVSRLRLPHFYASNSDERSESALFTCFVYCLLGFDEALAVSHYILDHLTGKPQMPKIPSLHASVDHMDQNVAARLSSYLSSPAAGVEEIVITGTRNSAPFENPCDAVVATLLRRGILQATTLRKITLRRMTVAENDLLALFHSNNTFLRELHLCRVEILPAKKKRWFPANPRTSPTQLTVDVSCGETKEGSAFIARLVRRLSSSGRLDKVTLIGFGGSLCETPPDGPIAARRVVGRRFVGGRDEPPLSQEQPEPSHVFKSVYQVQNVVFDSCYLTKNQLLELTIGLEKHRGMKSLAFSKCRFSRRAARMLGKVMEKAQGLYNVEINELTSHAARTSLLRGLWQNRSIQSLSISESSIQWKGKASHGLDIFATTSSLVSLRLRLLGSYYERNTLSVLCRKLQHNQTLHSLHISCMTYLGHLSNYISQSSSLQELTVEECHFRSPQFWSLLKAIAVNAALRKLCVQDCCYLLWPEDRNFPLEIILPKMKLRQLHLDVRFMPDMVLERLVRGIKGNYNLLQFSSRELFDERERLRAKADKYITRNLRYHATLALAGSSGAKCLPHVISALSSLSTDRFLVFEVLAQHCDTFSADDTQYNHPRCV